MQEDDYCACEEEKKDEGGSRSGSHAQSFLLSSKTTTAGEWNTIVEARVADCCNNRLLSDLELRQLLIEFGVESKSDIQNFLWKNIVVLSSSQEKAAERRKSYQMVKSFFERIDQAKKKAASAASLQQENESTGCGVLPESLDGLPHCAAEKAVQEEESDVVQTGTRKDMDDAMESTGHSIGIHSSDVPGSLCSNSMVNKASSTSESVQKDSPTTNSDKVLHCVHHLGPNDIVFGPAYDFLNRQTGAYALFDQLLGIFTAEFLHARTAKAKQHVCRVIGSKFRFLGQESSKSSRLVVLGWHQILEYVEKALVWKAEQSSRVTNGSDGAHVQQNLQPLKALRPRPASASHSSRSSLVMPRQISDFDVLIPKGYWTTGKKIFMEQYALLKRKGGHDSVGCAHHAIMAVYKFGGRFLKPVNQSNNFWEVVDAIQFLKAIRETVAASRAAPDHDALNAVRDLCRCTKRDVLFGNLDFVQSWPANDEMAKLLSSYSKTFPHCPQDQQTARKNKIVCNAMFATVKKGGRFLQHCQGKTGPETLVEEAWMTVDPKTVVRSLCQLVPDCSTMAPHGYRNTGRNGPDRLEEHPHIRRTFLVVADTNRYGSKSSVASCNSSDRVMRPPWDARQTEAGRLRKSSSTRQRTKGPDTIDLTACDSEEESDDNIITQAESSTDHVPDNDSTSVETNGAVLSQVTVLRCDNIANLLRDGNDAGI